ncbi:hypothetical protein [Pseudalgibacter alginicilyticus]|nr:hypothetical protein [Pseudalgibacter alginicilyticus]
MKIKDFHKALDVVFSDWYQYNNYEEKMYFTFSDIPNKKKFVKYVRKEYLPSIYLRLNEYENLEGAYYSNICNLINHKIEFLENWLIDKEEFYKLSKFEEPTPSKPAKRSGRPKTEIKNAIWYLDKFQLDENKAKFLKILNEKYKGVEAKTFNHLIMVLKDRLYLKPASNIEYRESFTEAIEPIVQKKQNFDKFFRDNTPDPTTYKIIKEQIDAIIKENTLV